MTLLKAFSTGCAQQIVAVTIIIFLGFHMVPTLVSAPQMFDP